MFAVLEKPAIRERVAPMTIGMYHALVESGNIEQDVELLDGFLIKRMPKAPLHEFLVKNLFRLLMAIVPEGYEINKESPITIGNSEPEPDISVVKGAAADFKERHPTTAELVVEVAVSSAALDAEKAQIYAQAQIPIYAILYGEEHRATIYTEPTTAGYAKKREAVESLDLPFIAKKIHIADIFR